MNDSTIYKYNQSQTKMWCKAMQLKTSRLLLAIIPAIFAFFLVSTTTLAMINSDTVAIVVGVGAALSSTAVILRH
ncbi:MAG: hypothetical protein O8C62_08540 [Candidatus Methanoperedens sp.]|nr:hypothetical protein [Candidatus Methanoperedens sp.]